MIVVSTPVRWVLLIVGCVLLWPVLFALYALISFGQQFFISPPPLYTWFPMAVLGLITPGLWLLFRPRRQPIGIRRGIVIGYIAVMPLTGFVTLVGGLTIIPWLLWIPGGIVLTIGMALGYVGARIVRRLRRGRPRDEDASTTDQPPIGD